MAPHFDTLIDVFNHAKSSYADRDLFGTKKNGAWQWMTYREFAQEVDRMRGALAGLGVGKGDAIAIISDNRVEWAVMAYASFGLGAALVPMYEAQLDKDWEFIANDCGAKVLVVASTAILEKTKPFLDTMPALKELILLSGDTGGAAHVHDYRKLLASGGEHEAIKPSPGETACLIYTSGTTGIPKGVVLSHANIASNVESGLSVFPITKEDRSLSFLPWAHSFGQTAELHCLVAAGASMGICESVSKILENLAEVRPTILVSVPRIFNRIYGAVQKQISEKPQLVRSLVSAAQRAVGKQRDGKSLSFGEGLILGLANRLVFSKVRGRFGGRLRYAVSGGAAISRDVAEFIDGLGITVYEGYGLTETSPAVAMNIPGARKIGSVGKPLPGIVVKIDAASGKRTEEGRDEGEIVVYGPNVMQGYHKRDDETAAVFTKDLVPGKVGFRTGDMGYLDADGFLYITGRIKEQYKLENGKYVVPTPLEEDLKLSPLIANVMVYGDNRPHNVALVVANLEAIRSWAEGEGVSLPPATQAILEHPKVRELYAREIKKYSEKFKGFESVQDFALLESDFTTDNGMLTPSLKLKRRAVLEKYGSVIDALYKKGRPARSASATAA